MPGGAAKALMRLENAAGAFTCREIVCGRGMVGCCAFIFENEIIRPNNIGYNSDMMGEGLMRE